MTLNIIKILKNNLIKHHCIQYLFSTGIIYRSICRNSFFYYFSGIRKQPWISEILNNSCVSLISETQIPVFRLSPKHIKSIRLNRDISKYREFGELKVLCLDTKRDMTSKYFTHFFIITRHYK